MADQARNDGELRTALFGMAVVASDSGKLDSAVQAMDKEYAVAEKKNDVAAMAADLQAKGNIIAEMAKYDVAAQQFDRSLQMVESSSLSQEIKDNAKLLHHYNLCALAIGKKDYAAAKTHAEEYRQGAEASKNPAQLKLAHELAGRIALAQKNYDDAIKELEQANQQDPRNLYRLGQAYQAKGDKESAQKFFAEAAGFNSLPALNYAFVRAKAQKMAAGDERIGVSMKGCTPPSLSLQRTGTRGWGTPTRVGRTLLSDAFDLNFAGQNISPANFPAENPAMRPPLAVFPFPHPEGNHGSVG